MSSSNSESDTLEKKYGVTFKSDSTSYQRKAWEKNEGVVKDIESLAKEGNANTSDVKGTSDLFVLQKGGITIFARRGLFSNGREYELSISTKNKEHHSIPYQSRLGVKPSVMKNIMVEIANGKRKVENYLDEYVIEKRKS